MNNRNFLRVIMVVFIIIGGIIIFIGRKPFPKPECIVCGDNILSILGLVEVILGAIALNLQNKVFRAGSISQ